MKKILRILRVGLFATLSLSGFQALAVETGGFANTTGGDNYPAVTVTTLAQLENAVNQHQHHIVVNGTIYGGAGLTTLTFATLDSNNTTIEGAAGGKAALENIQLKFDGELLPAGTNIQNIKIANLKFYGNISDLQAMPTQTFGSTDAKKTAGINYEGISFRRITNGLITHCDIHDASDDLMSVTLSSDYITLSYNHLWFSDAWVNMSPNPVWNWVGYNTDLADERLAMVVGANGNDSYAATKKLRVTLHDNWIGPNVRGRPLFRGWIHAYNNYFDNSEVYSDSDMNTGTDGNKYPKAQYEAMQINSGSVVISENNYFLRTNYTNKVSVDGSGYPYSFYERGNTYDGVTGTSATGGSFGKPVSYAYTPIASQEVPKAVMTNAGPK